MSLSSAEARELEQLEREVGQRAGPPKVIGPLPQPGQKPPRIIGPIGRVSGLSPMEQAELEQLEAELAPKPQSDSWLDMSLPLGTTPRGIIKGGLQSLPTVGALGGGVIGTAFTPGAGTLAGGVLGAGAGKALENLGESFLGEEKTRQQVYLDPVNEMAFEAALLGGGAAIGKGIGFLGRNIKDPVVQTASRLAKPKAAAPAIESAAKRLGTKATPGMLADSPMLQKIESSISQSVTPTGQKTAQSMRDVDDALRGGAQKLLGTQKESAVDLGKQTKTLIKAKLDERIKPAVDVFQDIVKDARRIEVGDKSKNLVSKSIMKLPYAQLTVMPESAFAQRISENVANIKNLEQLRNLKTYVGSISRDQAQNATMRSTAGDIAEKLGRMEQSVINRASIEAATHQTRGLSVARQMIGEIKKANKIYREASKETKQVSEALGFGKVRNIQEFLNKVADAPEEALAGKLFDLNKSEAVKHFQKNFPEAFETLRKTRLQTIYNSAIDNAGDIVPAKLIAQTKKISPEMRKLVFGDNADTLLKDIETVYGAKYPKVGPSGTPEGINYAEFNVFSPTSWLNELSQRARSEIISRPGLLKKIGGSSMRKAAKTPPQSAIKQEFKGLLKKSTVPRGLLGLVNEGDEE